MAVTIIGVGLGNPDTMTLQAQRAIEQATVVIGAKRLIEPYGHKICLPLIGAQDIAKAVAEAGNQRVAVLLSGDVGFYSGAKKLYSLLPDAQVMAGVSSVQYFCAKLCTAWDDAHLISAHGRSHNAVGEIQCHSKTFLLTGSNFTVMDLVAQLVDRGLGQCTLSVGENLSYDTERIVTEKALDLQGVGFAPLSVALVENPQPICSDCTAPHLKDDAFLRGKAPMTKEEIRVLSVSKLQIKPHHVLWDVGAGTGSVTVELARSAYAGQVFAVEQKGEAVALLQENKAQFALPNIAVIEGKAPEALAALPAPDGVFIGGSSGNLEEIIALVLAKNPVARLVITAVTLETIAQVTALLAKSEFEDVDMVQLSATRTRQAGRYHLMDAQNPVWLFSAQGSACHG